TDQLMGEIWGDRVPRRATAGLHVYVSELRKILNRACPRRAESPIVTHSPGYMLRCGTDELDFQSFLELIDLGRNFRREQCYQEASECFEAALALWRGPVLGDLSDGPIVVSFATWMMETRLECIEILVDTHLHLGRHRELIGLLYSLIAESPLREAFYRQLMLALYHSERKADALKVYQQARTTLSEELGLEPCRTLQDIQRAILQSDDRSLACAAIDPARIGRTPPAPAWA
ncbi:MAG TPA: AfsR/SARP family transcriptional regulator, partial [Nonomuraea sp.]|nr:AfsR/SARP family transcriptional regulator [Nonomuraea sp.]